MASPQPEQEPVEEVTIDVDDEYTGAVIEKLTGPRKGELVEMKPAGSGKTRIVAHVPWVDVVTTMLDASIPLTTSEYDEWGDPKKREYYDYMLSYSPYDNVEAKDYPAMLVTTALEDSQVQYFEPAKWVAKLRAMKTDAQPLLLKTELEAAGHGGVSGRFNRYHETALEYAFILEVLNGAL